MNVVAGKSLSAIDERPSQYGAPGAIASLLGAGIQAPLVDRMLAKPSTRKRLDVELNARLGTLPSDRTALQDHILLLDPPKLVTLALQAGAVWHASFIARVYDGASVRALAERIGPEFREAAIADLASNPALATLPHPDLDLEKLPAAIARDGAACLVAWCECQPRPIGWRILLKLRISSKPTAHHAQIGSAIVDRLLEKLTQAPGF